MTTQEAKEILAGYRPGTKDDLDPLFAEALALARKDPALQAWLDDSLAFDAAMKTELARVAAPESLQTAILLESRIVQAPWWNRRKEFQWAAAAALALLAAISALWFSNRPVSFSDFQQEISDRAWDVGPHVHGDALTLVEVRRALEDQGLTAEFPLPPKLSEGGLRGYSIVEWRGRRIPVLCFDSEGQHLFLFVTDRSLFSDVPEQRPEFHQGIFSPTISWADNDFAYVLSGLKIFEFVKKFRRDRRWDWES
jgi:hypothetical protein